MTKLETIARDLEASLAKAATADERGRAIREALRLAALAGRRSAPAARYKQDR